MEVCPRLVKTNAPAPKKRFGQHFLRDRGVLERIVKWIAPEAGDLFLDIGAGDGALSRGLAPMASRLISIELDDDCIPRLETALSGFPNAAVVQGDILRLDLAALVSPHLLPGTRLRIAGNLPYNIATVIIERLLSLRLPIADMAFMVQLEVARRITAVPATREYGYFSVLCQHRADVRFGFKVSPACFVPRPKVGSAMVAFRLKPQTRDPALESDFESLAKAAFAYRRKTLENALSRNAEWGALCAAMLGRTGIRGTRRAEELSVAEYETLADCGRSLRTAGRE